jgi:peptidoglycan/LPS O-acetylase OafA/YrhL
MSRATGRDPSGPLLFLLAAIIIAVPFGYMLYLLYEVIFQGAGSCLNSLCR